MCAKIIKIGDMPTMAQISQLDCSRAIFNWLARITQCFSLLQLVTQLVCAAAMARNHESGIHCSPPSSEC